MPAFERTQAEIARFRERVLEAAKRAVPERVQEVVEGSAIVAMQGVLGIEQSFDEASLLAGNITSTIDGEGTPVAQPRLWKRPVRGYVGGRLRANWQIQEGSPKRNIIDSTDENRAERELDAFKVAGVREPFTIVWITNNLPYGPALEAGAVRPYAPYRPGFLFRAAQVAREFIEDVIREDRELLGEE